MQTLRALASRWIAASALAGAVVLMPGMAEASRLSEAERSVTSAGETLKNKCDNFQAALKEDFIEKAVTPLQKKMVGEKSTRAALKTDWRSQRYELIATRGAASDSAPHYEIRDAGGKEKTFRQVIEASLPFDCRGFRTGLTPEFFVLTAPTQDAGDSGLQNEISGLIAAMQQPTVAPTQAGSRDGRVSDHAAKNTGPMVEADLKPESPAVGQVH